MALIEERLAYTLYLHRPDFVTQYSFFLNYFLRLNVVKWVLRPVSDLADVCRYRYLLHFRIARVAACLLISCRQHRVLYLFMTKLSSFMHSEEVFKSVME